MDAHSSSNYVVWQPGLLNTILTCRLTPQRLFIMHLAVCFQTNQHVGEAALLSFFHLGGGNSSLTVWEPQILKCACLLSWASTYSSFLWCKRRRRKEKRPLFLKCKETGCAKQGSLCWGGKSSRSGKPEACPAAHRPAWVCPYKRHCYWHTDPVFFFHTHSLKYFKQNTSNFLFWKPSRISNSIPSNPGKWQDKPPQSIPPG